MAVATKKMAVSLPALGEEGGVKEKVVSPVWKRIVLRFVSQEWKCWGDRMLVRCVSYKSSLLQRGGPGSCSATRGATAVRNLCTTTRESPHTATKIQHSLKE